MAKGTYRNIDVIECKMEGGDIYALSCFGWGLAGAVALKAAKLRWIPGQKKARYDIAGFVTMLRVGLWGISCSFFFSFPFFPRPLSLE